MSGTGQKVLSQLKGMQQPGEELLSDMLSDR